MDPSNLHHSPSQKVGLMRVSKKSNRRTSCINHQPTKSHQNKADGNDSASFQNTQEEQGDNNSKYKNETKNTSDNEEESEENKDTESGDLILVSDLQDRHARDLQAHTASRNLNIPANPGTNVKLIRHSNVQKKGLSHWNNTIESLLTTKNYKKILLIITPSYIVVFNTIYI